MLFYEKTPNLNDGEFPLGTVKPSLILVMPAALLSLLFTLILAYTSFNLIDYFQYYIYVLSDFYFDKNQLKVIILSIGLIIFTLPVMIKVITIKTTSFEFTSQRLYYMRGILTQKRDQLELSRIRDVATIKPLWLRVFGLGHVILDTADRSHPILVIPAQEQPDILKDWVHYINKHERQRLGYREFENTAF